MKKFTLTFEMEDGPDAATRLSEKTKDMIEALREAYESTAPFFDVNGQAFFVAELVEDGDEVRAVLNYLD